MPLDDEVHVKRKQCEIQQK